MVLRERRADTGSAANALDEFAQRTDNASSSPNDLRALFHFLGEFDKLSPAFIAFQRTDNPRRLPAVDSKLCNSEVEVLEGSLD